MRRMFSRCCWLWSTFASAAARRFLTNSAISLFTIAHPRLPAVRGEHGIIELLMARARHVGRSLYRLVSVRTASASALGSSFGTSRGYRTVPTPRAPGLWTIVEALPYAIEMG